MIFLRLILLFITRSTLQAFLRGVEFDVDRMRTEASSAIKIPLDGLQSLTHSTRNIVCT